jgi:predicted Zn-dependent protease
LKKENLKIPFKSKQKIRDEFGHALGIVGNSSVNE